MTVLPLDRDVNTLVTRLNNHCDANCDAISYFVEQHDLGPEEREQFTQSLRLNSEKLLALAQRLEIHTTRKRGL